MTRSPLDGLRVLVVEDNFVLAESMKWALQELGCVVVGPASTVARAIETIEAEELDAAILDVDLQGTTSTPVAKVLRERGRPFLFLTGFDSSSFREEELQGALCLSKPVDPKVLAEALLGIVQASGTAERPG